MLIDRLLSLSHVSVIAHRGGAKLRPENTLAAFDHAMSFAVDGLECDIHLSRDDVPVVIHDPTLERTTDATGAVSARSADELGRIDAGYRFGEADGFPFRGAGFGVPRLEDLLRRHAVVPFVLEIKGEDPRTAERAIEVVRAAGAEDRVIIGGFSSRVLDAVRHFAPDLATSAARDEVRSGVRRSRLGLRPRRTGYAVLQAPYRFRGRTVFGRAFVRAARRAGVPVHAWIVDEVEEMARLVDWGVTGLISDRPDVAVQVRRERPMHG